MIFLTSTSDLLQVITTAVGLIDVHTSWVDLAAGVVTAGRTNTSIATATTTTVVGSPAASTTRNVKTFRISNNHASISQTVTVRHTDGTTAIILESVSLAPGEAITYGEGSGMRVLSALGVERSASAAPRTGASPIADVTANAADTYIVGMPIDQARLQAGTFLKWRFRMTKTGAGAATPIFTLRYGALGTVADAAIGGGGTITSSAQTGVVDTGMIELDTVFRAIGAAATIMPTLFFSHNLTTTGLGASQFQFLGGTISNAFNSAVANGVLGLSCNPGTLGVWTFQEATVEINNYAVT